LIRAGWYTSTVVTLWLTLVARESGYIFQLRPLKDLCQSLKSGMPCWPKASAVGVRRNVDALAYSCNRPYFELQGMDDLKLKDILFEWDEQDRTTRRSSGRQRELSLAEAADNSGGRNS